MTDATLNGLGMIGIAVILALLMALLVGSMLDRRRNKKP